MVSNISQFFLKHAAVLAGSAFTLLLSNCSNKPEGNPIPLLTTAVYPSGSSDVTEDQNLLFVLTIAAEQAGSTVDPLKSGKIYFTLDGTDPDTEATALTADLTTARTLENGSIAYGMSEGVVLTDTTQLKYFGVVTLEHKTSEKEATGQVKKETQELIVQGTIKTEDYTFVEVPPETTPDPVVTTPAPILQFSSGQAASLVIGQSDFTSNALGYTADKMNGPGAVFLSSTGVLYVSESNISRVSGFTTVPTTNGASADIVFGQSSVNGSSGGGSASNRLNSPGSVFANGSQLFIADGGNNRIMIYNNPTTTAAAADIAIGQTSPTLSVTPGSATAAVVKFASGLSVAGSKIAIADTVHSRILLYNTIPTASGASADFVLGQSLFTTSASGSVSGMNYPLAVWTNGTKIVATDNYNSRVLIWNSWPTANGQLPEIVLGQTTLAGTSQNPGGISASTFLQPVGVTSDGTQLAISDIGNNRVLIWNTWPTQNMQAADLVLGQSDFTSSTAGTSATALSMPEGLFLDTNRLFVADRANNRVLIFEKK